MNKIDLYYKKNLIWQISKNLKYKINKKSYINIKFFYWLYCKIYERNSQGLCIRKSNKKYINCESILLYLKYKDLKINQLYFLNSPFNILISYKNLKNKKIKKIYIL